MGRIATATVVPTVDIAGAYAAGDLIDDKLTITNVFRNIRGSAVLEAVLLADAAKQNAALDLVLFGADPSNTTFTDQAALTVDDADLAKIIGVIRLNNTDYNDFAANSIACLMDLGLPLRLAAMGTDIYAALVCRDTPTYVAADDLTLRLTVRQD